MGGAIRRKRLAGRLNGVIFDHLHVDFSFLVVCRPKGLPRNQRFEDIRFPIYQKPEELQNSACNFLQVRLDTE